MPEEPDADTYKLAMEEGRRAIDQQREDFKTIRDRTTALLAASGVVAAFVGGLAWRDKTAPLTSLTYASIAAFAIIVVITVLVLWPRWVTLAQDSQEIITWVEKDGLDAAAVTRSIAYYHGANHAANRKVLDWMTIGYQVAVFFLAVEVITLMIDLRGS